MAFLTHNDKQRIAEAVRAVETRTRGELVTVIAHASDDYAHIPWLWGALIALAVPGVFEIYPVVAPLWSIHLIQVAVFFTALFSLSWPALKIALAPRALKEDRAARLAREQFFVQRLHMTRERTGVLLFVSVAEHYVEIIADAGIDQAVPPGTWDHIVQDFIATLKSGHTAEGFLVAIDACGAELAEHFPPRPDDVNELPNALVEL